MVIKCLCIVRVMLVFSCLTVSRWRWVWEFRGESGMSVSPLRFLFCVTNWAWLPVWLCAAVRPPQLCPSVGPSGGRAHPGSGAAHTARHTPGSCQQPEPAITNTHAHDAACACVGNLYTLLWGKLTLQLFGCWVKHADGARWMEKQ